jgi:hypothetical protein
MKKREVLLGWFGRLTASALALDKPAVRLVELCDQAP